MKKEKIFDLLLFILFFIVVLSIIILNPINNLDELWNYNFARNIADGLIPYRDFNMLQMPLLPIICGIILNIIANELIVMRILAAILCAGIFLVTYKLFEVLNIKKELKLIFTVIIAYLFKDLLCIDYNYATLFLVLIIIFKETKNYKKDNVFLKCNIKNDIILGLLAGLTVTLKQTTGLFICAALLGNKLLFVKNKKEFKIYIKSFVFRLIGIVVPISFMVIYLLLNNVFLDFINYTISGVSGFSNYISYSKLLNFNLIGALSILVPLTFIVEWYRTIILEKNKISYIFLVYGLAMFVVCFPISDSIHFSIGAMPTIILLTYETYLILEEGYKKYLRGKKLKNDKITIFIILTFKYILLLLLIYLCILNTNKYISKNYSKLSHFKYIPVNVEFENQIKEVSKYIKENENVKILDASAAVYMIPINRYNKDYDMLLKGNLGEDGEKRIIKEISNSKNVKYLILKDEFSKNWQTPISVIEHVQKIRKRKRRNFNF